VEEFGDSRLVIVGLDWIGLNRWRYRSEAAPPLLLFIKRMLCLKGNI